MAGKAKQHNTRERGKPDRPMAPSGKASRAIQSDGFDLKSIQPPEGRPAYDSHAQSQVDEAIFVTDADLTITYWSDTAEHLYGSGSDDVLGKNVLDVVGSHLADDERDGLKRQLLESGRAYVEFARQQADGAEARVESSLVALHGENGQVIGYVGVNHDVSERRKVELALRSSQEQFRRMFDEAPIGIGLVDSEDKWVSVNKTLSALLGYPQDELESRSFLDAIHPEDVQRDRDLVRQLWDRTVCGYKIDLRYLTREGRTVWAHVTASLIQADDSVYRLVMIEDVTERKRAEEVLAGQALTLQAQARLLELTHDGIFVRDMNGTITYWNRGAEEMYGWSKKEAVGNSADKLLRTEFPKPFSEVEAEIGLQGHWEGELFRSRRDGTGIVVASRWALQRGEAGEPVAILEMSNDITERMRAQEMLESARDELEMRVEQRTAELQTINQKLRNEIAERTRMEEALRANEARFRLLAENAQDLIYRIEFLPVQHFDFVSPSATLITGYTSEEYYANPDLIFQLAHPEDRPTLEAAFGGQVATDVPIVARWIRKDGAVIWLELRNVITRDESGNVLAIEGIARDITERKRTEEALHRANLNLVNWASELEQRNREARLLNEMGDLLQSCFVVDEAYQVVAHTGPNLFPNDSGALYVLSESRNMVQAVATWGERQAESIQQVFAPEDCWALRRGRIHVVSDPRSGLLCRHISPATGNGGVPPVGAYICVPMVAQGETLGVFHLHTAAGQSLSESKQRLVISVAEHLALAISSLKLRHTLHQQAIRDPLTGLFNRRYLSESLEREMHRATRRNSTVGVVMLDLDYFKQFNDNFGHDVGDAILRSLGLFLQTHVREEDVACRYGGEEFALVISGMPLEQARSRAEELRQGIKSVNVEYHGQIFGNLTVSMGVALFPMHADSPEGLLQAADVALYRAKAAGRDQVVISPALP